MTAYSYSEFPPAERKAAADYFTLHGGVNKKNFNLVEAFIKEHPGWTFLKLYSLMGQHRLSLIRAENESNPDLRKKKKNSNLGLVDMPIEKRDEAYAFLKSLPGGNGPTLAVSELVVTWINEKGEGKWTYGMLRDLWKNRSHPKATRKKKWMDDVEPPRPSKRVHLTIDDDLPLPPLPPLPPLSTPLSTPLSPPPGLLSVGMATLVESNKKVHDTLESHILEQFEILKSDQKANEWTSSQLAKQSEDLNQLRLMVETAEQRCKNVEMKERLQRQLVDPRETVLEEKAKLLSIEKKKAACEAIELCAEANRLLQTQYKLDQRLDLLALLRKPI